MKNYLNKKFKNKFMILAVFFFAVAFMYFEMVYALKTQLEDLRLQKEEIKIAIKKKR